MLNVNYLAVMPIVGVFTEQSTTKDANKLFDGFIGKLNKSKWAKISKCSQDTALRDILDLIGKGILIKSEDGDRSTNYELKMKAIICTKYGQPEVFQIKEIDKPVPKKNEVLIKILAANVTISDCIV